MAAAKTPPKAPPFPAGLRPKKPSPPDHLDKIERGMWRETVELYDFHDGPSQSLLRTALEAHQRARECREAIVRDGMMTADRFGQLKAHPLLSAERDARAAFLNAMRHLALDMTGVNR